MTNSEFSNNFSTLLNSYGSQPIFGEQAAPQDIVLDEYEKSVLLSEAQDIIVKSYYDRTLNQQGQGFDDSTRRQIDFSSLIKVATLSPVTQTSSSLRFDDRGIVYQMPKRDDSSNVPDNTAVLFILNEKLLLKDNEDKVIAEYVIKPISYSEYDRIMSKPFTKPLKKQAWRLFQNQATGFDVMSELIPRDAVGAGQSLIYRIRYVKRPRPIVLETLPDGLSIDGVSAETSCELNPSLHMDILNKAVELALTTRGRYPVQEKQSTK